MPVLGVFGVHYGTRRASRARRNSASTTPSTRTTLSRDVNPRSDGDAARRDARRGSDQAADRLVGAPVDGRRGDA